MFKKAKYVYAVYTEGSFTRAAKKLYISQPCLSAAIKQIEAELGAPLFKRQAFSVKPTELGLSYVKTAEQIIALENEFIENINRERSLTRGTVRVGGSNYISSYILPSVVDSFSKQYPNITVSLTEASSSELSRLLLEDELDLVVDSFDAPLEEYSHYFALLEKIILAVSASFDSNEKMQRYGISPSLLYESEHGMDDFPSVSIKHFKNEKFILLKDGNNMREHAMEAFKKSGFTPDVSLFLDQLSTSYFLAAQGNGACFVTDTIFRYHKFDDSVLLYNIKEGGSRMLDIVHKKGKYTTPAMDRFIDTFCTVMKNKNTAF